MNLLNKSKDELIDLISELEQENIFLKEFNKNSTGQEKGDDSSFTFNELHHLLFQNIGEGIAFANSKQEFIFANPAAEEIFGVQKGELNGSSFIEFLDSKGIEQAKRMKNDRTDGVRSTLKHKLILRNGEIKYIHATGSPWIKNEKLLGTFVVFHDITDKVRLEEELKKSQSLLKETQRIGKVGGWEFNIDTNEATWTEESYRILEIDDFSIKPNPDLAISFYTPSSRQIITQAIDHSIKTGEPFNEELQLITAKGNPRWVKAIGVINYEQRRIFGFSQDITERKKNEERILNKNKELKITNDEKDKLFSIIAHDLTNPLSYIFGFSKLLSEQIRNKSIKEIEKHAEIIQKSSVHALDLLKNLKEWSLSLTGRMGLNCSRFDMEELINQETLLFAQVCEQKAIRITKDVPSDKLVYGDKKMLGSVMRNLLSNAIKFSHKGGEIIISMEEKHNVHIISIKDTGVGIPKARINAIFQFDLNLSTSSTQNEKGSGLGLILCKEFIEKHKGNIWVDSEVNKGSTFYYSLPLNKDKE